MKYGFIATSAALIMTGGVALAQSSTYSQTTTTTTAPAMTGPAPVAPPLPGTLSSTETTKATDGYGNSYESSKTTYGNANGAASDSVSTTTTAPAGTYYSKKTTTTTTSGESN